MSHTTTLKTVSIRDLAALRAAVEELNAAGVSCDLVERAVPRMFYASQHGECDYVLKLHKCRFDVGFDKQADGSYVPVYDEWGNNVGTQIGATCNIAKTPEEKATQQIGRLMQGYAKHAAVNAAVSQGYFVESTVTDEKGTVHLVLGGM